MSKALNDFANCEVAEHGPNHPCSPEVSNCRKALNIDFETMLCDEVIVPECCYRPVTVNLTRG